MKYFFTFDILKEKYILNQERIVKKMKLIDPVVYVEDYDAKKMLKRIERACRTCYRSEDKVTEDSYKNLIKNCISRGQVLIKI